MLIMKYIIKLLKNKKMKMNQKMSKIKKPMKMEKIILN